MSKILKVSKNLKYNKSKFFFGYEEPSFKIEPISGNLDWKRKMIRNLSNEKKWLFFSFFSEFQNSKNTKFFKVKISDFIFFQKKGKIKKFKEVITLNYMLLGSI